MRCGVLVLLCLGVRTFAVPLKQPRAETCGYDACTGVDPNALNVHIVAHSHDDVGWLKTVDQYYYGSRSGIQLAGVQYIIDSVISALRANPERKFIQVETAFFYKWWFEQTDAKRALVKELVNSGQLEIAGGAWSMNDEAAAHYHSIIDQFTYGLKFVDRILGKCGRPRIGWQIDPFGHTREMASIFAQMGYDALFFARLDWRDKSLRLKTKTAEMLWQGSANLDDSLLFTHALYNHYSPPPGFYFDVLSEDDPLIPDQSSSEYNLDIKMDALVEFINNQTRGYPTNNIIITMGNDFTYQDAHFNFKNLDILIQAFKDTEKTDENGRRIHLLYSTPGCYIKAVHDYTETNDIKFQVKTDDFIPLGNDQHTYWSGYYTSRPTQKRFERQGNNFLQVAKQLTAFSGNDVTQQDQKLDILRSAMGIMQHHDAITGTEKQHVADDYARLVMKAMDKSHENINEVLPTLLSKNNGAANLDFKSCLLANVSHCETSQDKRQFVVAIHNPLSRTVSYHVRLPVDSDDFIITDSDGNSVVWQVVPSIHSFAYLPSTIRPSKLDLVFQATDLPPLGVKLFHIQNNAFQQPPKEINPVEDDSRFDLGDEDHGASLNPNTGFLNRITINKLEVSVGQEMMYYYGAQGDNMVFANRSSGAYIFRPDPKDSEAKPLAPNLLGDLKVYKGVLVDEAHQTYNSWVKQIIRVYKSGENNIELDWLVGPIDSSLDKSREVISRFTSNLGSTEFYTDSNGRELITRKKGHRPTFEYTDEEPIAGNYYPVTTSISLADKQRGVEMVLLNDRAQAGSSLKPGQLELMVHRRLLKDDAFGVGEALKEEEFSQGMLARGQHFLTVGSTKPSSPFANSRQNLRDITQRKLLAPWVFVADATDVSLQDLQAKLNFKFAGLTRDLDKRVQILTLEPWGVDKVLMRFEHVFEKAEDATEVEVDLAGLFQVFEVDSLDKMKLGANQAFEEQRLVWKKGDCLPGSDDCKENKIPEFKSKDVRIDGVKFVIKPMEIHTYIATVTFRNQNAV